MSKIVKLVGKTLNGLSYIAPKYASQKALNLFSTPRKGRVNEHQVSFLESATKAIIKYNHLDVATYVWKGTNKKILLAHGWESNTFRWNTLIEDLKKDNHTIIALDAPAHGNTSGKYFNAILYAECINEVVKKHQPDIIIGHSVGGMATGFYQYKYQNKKIEKLVLLGAPSEFTGVFKRYVDMLGYNERIENGLNKREVSDFLKSDIGTKEVSREELRAREMNIFSVPTYIFNKKYFLVGGQEPDTFKAYIRKVMEVESKDKQL